MAQPLPIQIWGTLALREAYEVLAPQFEQAQGHKLAIHWIPTVDLMSRLRGGDVTDLVITTAKGIDELVDAGVLNADSRTPIARSGVGVAVRAGAPKPSIGSADELRQALLSASSIAYSTGPSGVTMAALIERMGLTETLRSRVKQVKGEPIGALIARGEAQIGFQQVSELLPIAGIDLVGPLPAEVQETTVFVGAVHVRSQAAAAAGAFARHLASPAAAPVLKAKGLEPA